MAGAITLCELNNKTRIEWKINHFFTRSDNLIISPDFRLFKSKWFLQIHLGTPFVLPFSRTDDVFLEPLRMSLLTPYSKAEHRIEYRMGIQRSDGTKIKTEKFESVLKPGFGQTPQRCELISKKDFESSINTLVSENTLTVFCSVSLLSAVEPAGDIPSPIQSIDNDISFPIIIFDEEEEMAGEIILDDSKNEARIDWKINDFLSRETCIIESPYFVLFNVKWYLWILKSSAKDISMKLCSYSSVAELVIEYRMGIQTTNGSEIITKKFEYPLQLEWAELISRNYLESSMDTLAHGNSLKVFCTLRLLSARNFAKDICLQGDLAFTSPRPCHKNNAETITLCKSNNDTSIEWTITNFFNGQNLSPRSPCFKLFGANWHLQINAHNKCYEDVFLCMSLKVCHFSMTEHYIEYRMGIQKPDGSEIITKKCESVFQRRFVKRSQKHVLISETDLESLKDTLAHENDLKVFCNVRLLSDEKMAENSSSLITSKYGFKDINGCKFSAPIQNSPITLKFGTLASTLSPSSTSSTFKFGIATTSETITTSSGFQVSVPSNTSLSSFFGAAVPTKASKTFEVLPALLTATSNTEYLKIPSLEISAAEVKQSQSNVTVTETPQLSSNLSSSSQIKISELYETPKISSALILPSQAVKTMASTSTEDTITSSSIASVSKGEKVPPPYLTTCLDFTTHSLTSSKKSETFNLLTSKEKLDLHVTSSFGSFPISSPSQGISKEDEKEDHNNKHFNPEPESTSVFQLGGLTFPKSSFTIPSTTAPLFNFGKKTDISEVKSFQTSAALTSTTSTTFTFNVGSLTFGTVGKSKDSKIISNTASPLQQKRKNLKISKSTAVSSTTTIFAFGAAVAPAAATAQSFSFLSSSTAITTPASSGINFGAFVNTTQAAKYRDTKTSSGSPKNACLCKEHQILIGNFESLYRSKRLADITVKVKNKEFQAHEAILSARSEVFASMFQHDTSEVRSGIVDITDCNPDSFEDFLLYLYTGKLDTVSSSNAVSLFKTADKYGVEALKDECVRCMIREMSVDSFCDVFHLAVLHGESNLLSTATEFFIKNASAILIKKEWLTLLEEHTSLCNELLVKFAKSGQQK